VTERAAAARACAAAVAALEALRATIAQAFAAERRLAGEAASLRRKAAGDTVLLAHAEALERDVVLLAQRRAVLVANEGPLLRRVIMLRALARAE
jgi:hypothetical protein